MLHITSLYPAARWMCQQTSPCCPNCPLFSRAVIVALSQVCSVSCLSNTPVQSTAPGTAGGSERWLLGSGSCLYCCKTLVVSILDNSSCILAEVSSPMPLDSLLPGTMGLPTTVSWCRGAQSSPCPGDEFVVCSRRHSHCQTPRGAGRAKRNTKSTRCNNETQL